MPATDVEAIGAEASSFPSTTTAEPVRVLLDLPSDALDALASRLPAASLARFSRASQGCAAAVARMVHVVVPAKVVQRLLAGRTAGELTCAKCPIMELPAGVTIVGEDAFRDCGALQSITLPPSVASICRAAFADCTALRSVSLPPSVTFLGSHVFSGCKSLTSISLPDGIGCIDDYVFAGCTALIAIAVPASVTCIGEGAFENCCALACINIPDSVDETGDNAFYNCPSLDADARERVYVVNGCAL